MPEPIVTLNEESLRSDLRELIRKAAEDTLNGLLEAEADDLGGVGRYERTAEREAHRAGRYDRGLTTSSGEATIRMPKLKNARFTTAIIERYRRRESSVEEAMMEMYPAGGSYESVAAMVAIGVNDDGPPRGPQANARGGHLPGREVGAHARHHKAQVRHGERVGIEALPGRDAA